MNQNNQPMFGNLGLSDKQNYGMNGQQRSSGYHGPYGPVMPGYGIPIPRPQVELPINPNIFPPAIEEPPVDIPAGMPGPVNPTFWPFPWPKPEGGPGWGPDNKPFAPNAPGVKPDTTPQELPEFPMISPLWNPLNWPGILNPIPRLPGFLTPPFI